MGGLCCNGNQNFNSISTKTLYSLSSKIIMKFEYNWLSDNRYTFYDDLFISHKACPFESNLGTVRMQYISF